MQTSFGILCILAAARASQIEVTPVQKVVALLGGMLEKGKKEKHDEELLFAASRQYCGDQESVISGAIKVEDQHIGALQATISKATADSRSLQKKIGALSKDEATWTSEKAAATSGRKREAETYKTTHKEYGESIDAIDRAVAVLKKQAFDRKQDGGASLAQVPSTGKAAVASLMDLGLVPASSKRALDLFLQQGEEESALTNAEGSNAAAPEANGYEFQANGVVDMLEKLQDKFIDEKTNLEKDEANSKHSFAMQVQDLDAQIEQAKKDRNDKSTNRASRMQVKADSTGDKKEEQKLEVVDTSSLSALKSSCTMKASDFELRQKLRTEELAGIEKAIEIISSGSVAGKAAKYQSAMMQKKKSTAFTFLQRSLIEDSDSHTHKIQDRVAEFLQAQASKLNSRVLKTVASRASADPFDKVKKMLQDLIVRLMDEANEETTHKGYCDTELGTNAQTRKEKSESVETLSAEIDELDASIAKLKMGAQTLTKAVSELNSAIATATQGRNAENKENTEAINDAQDAQTALAQASTVLKEFYAKASEATSLLQQPYQGMQDMNGGVVAMLEVIESDFARLEAETKANEATSQKQYDTYITDAKVEKAAKNTAAENKDAKSKDETVALRSKKVDLEETHKALDAALSYFEKLKPSCVDAGVSYDDRVSRRKAEIESLQEALKVMSGTDLA